MLLLIKSLWVLPTNVLCDQLNMVNALQV